MFWNLFTLGVNTGKETINRKHEMFWNIHYAALSMKVDGINRKHEMFWNNNFFTIFLLSSKLTVNMKCFEMQM